MINAQFAVVDVDVLLLIIQTDQCMNCFCLCDNTYDVLFAVGDNYIQLN